MPGHKNAAITHSSAMNRLVAELAKLPGLGTRSAQRIAFYLLKAPADQPAALAAALTDLRLNTLTCSNCCNVSESDPCPICRDSRRDPSTVLVVEQPADVVSLEQTAQFRGLYHVLMGRLAPLDGLGPGELTIDRLLARVDHDAVREVILGTQPSVEGDGTALYLQEALRSRDVKVSRLARGLPTGASLDMVSKAVLVDAISGRQAL